jgi:FMN reductase
LVKNALDYVEELSSDQRAYFDNIPVGCIATGSGWQGANSTLMSLRSIVHALRGWPTPLGLALNTSEPLFDASGACISADIDAQFRLMASQVVAFAESRIADGTDRSKVSQTYSHDNEREAPLR